MKNINEEKSERREKGNRISIGEMVVAVIMATIFSAMGYKIDIPTMLFLLSLIGLDVLFRAHNK